MAQTLDELKAENAAADTAAETENAATETESEASPQAAEEEKEVEAVEEEQEESTEDAESEEKETSDTDTEEWMQGDSHESQAEKKYTGEDIGKAKGKLKAKLEKRHDSEVEKLQARIQELEGQPKAEGLVKPKRDDYDDADDPDEAYFEALTDWKLNNHQATVQASQATDNATRQQQEQAKATETAVDQHYVRAMKLAEQSGISPELYQGADLRVREMVESVYPGGGDLITDGLIANLGEGSEKVLYNLGVNTQRGSEFISRLKADKTGIKAAVYLGQLNAELNAPSKRKTNAPKPAPHIEGDEQSGDRFRALKGKYDQAHKSNDTQAAFNIRREAKKAGADVSKW